MKHRILPNQALELSDNAKKRLRKWWKIRGGDFFFLEEHPEHELMQHGAEQTSKGKWFRVSGLGQRALPLMDITMLMRFLRDHANRQALLDGQEMHSAIPIPLEGDGWLDVDNLVDNLWAMVVDVLEEGKL